MKQTKLVSIIGTGIYLQNKAKLIFSLGKLGKVA